MIMKMTNEKLKKYPFPNLMAEISESGYSICTIGDHMGLGSHCQEDDPEVWGRLRGDIELSAHEAIGLVCLFNCTYEYLVSSELSVVGEKSVAYYRWYDSNLEREYDIKASDLGYKILAELREKPYMYEFMKMAIGLNEDEIKAATKMLTELNSRMMSDIIKSNPYEKNETMRILGKQCAIETIWSNDKLKKQIDDIQEAKSIHIPPEIISDFFMLGYIHGKRIERARRKK